jgi:hypothetical protein
MRTVGVVLAIVFSFLGAEPALAFGDCRTPGYLPRFDARLPAALPVDCTLILRVDIETGRLRVPMRLIRYQEAPALGDDAAMRYLRLLAAKTGAAMHLLGDLDLAQVSILLTDAPPPTVSADGSNPAHGWAPGWRADDECTIAFFKQAGPVSEEYFLISVAHEIFHCVQGKTWREKTGLHPVGEWWIEGSAVYFSHLVVPDTAQLDFLAAAFDASSPRTALVDMDYDASVFFLWLHGRAGPHTGVYRLIEAMPDSGGREAQISALRGVLTLDRFAEFAEDYLDAEIRQPGGRAVPSSVRVSPTTTFSGPRAKSSAVEPYVIGREMFVFREGKSYDLETAVSESGRVRFQEGAGGDWRAPPAEISACDSDKHYVVAFVATDAPATAEFQVTDAEALDRRACCLIGDWRPTTDSLSGFAQAANEIGGPEIGARGGSFACAYAGGGWTLSFRPDGGGAVQWEDFANRCVATGPGPGSIVQTSITSGDHEFEWSIADVGAGRWAGAGNSVVWRIIIEIGPQTIDRSYPDAGPSTPSGGFAYQCSATDLTIRGIYGLNQYEATHTRSAEPRP